MDTALRSGKALWQLRQGGKERWMTRGTADMSEENQKTKWSSRILSGRDEESVDHSVVDRPGPRNLGPTSRRGNERGNRRNNLRRT